ncbi:(SSU ribosomal protein S18P)-alanine acetyltransferase [Thalassoporum mexicanum PCC 7367]|uniref:ribosomal protein S18-alanine N-acetyltransferase n=1 Tax=Thalassoporum mexicanum TaxID=3457544 RepID=UPI00029F8F1F|nr:ribosomal protein S18-alanine N-acetyltransferase [Pseudanabaena sp. PCC 7367]AFY71263.1 (SSU ribosomal protein S18P)-alanine acetyltransferase [Pseudanabaena sp. PCC 7367]
MHQLKLCQVSKELLTQIKTIDDTCLGGLWSLQAYEQEIENPKSTLIALINEAKQVLGYGCLWRVLEESHITILAVQPDWQSLGFGHLLVWGLLKVARDDAAEWTVLEVRESNQYAIKLYENFDFLEVGRRHGYYQITGEDALIMWRKGLQEPEFGMLLAEWQEQIWQRVTAKLFELGAEPEGSKVDRSVAIVDAL